MSKQQRGQTTDPTVQKLDEIIRLLKVTIGQTKSRRDRRNYQDELQYFVIQRSNLADGAKLVVASDVSDAVLDKKIDELQIYKPAFDRLMADFKHAASWGGRRLNSPISFLRAIEAYCEAVPGEVRVHVFKQSFEKLSASRQAWFERFMSCSQTKALFEDVQKFRKFNKLMADGVNREEFKAALESLFQSFWSLKANTPNAGARPYTLNVRPGDYDDVPFFNKLVIRSVVVSKFKYQQCVDMPREHLPIDGVLLGQAHEAITHAGLAMKSGQVDYYAEYLMKLYHQVGQRTEVTTENQQQVLFRDVVRLAWHKFPEQKAKELSNALRANCVLERVEKNLQAASRVVDKRIYDVLTGFRKETTEHVKRYAYSFPVPERKIGRLEKFFQSISRGFSRLFSRKKSVVAPEEQPQAPIFSGHQPIAQTYERERKKQGELQARSEKLKLDLAKISKASDAKLTNVVEEVNQAAVYRVARGGAGNFFVALKQALFSKFSLLHNKSKVADLSKNDGCQFEAKDYAQVDQHLDMRVPEGQEPGNEWKVPDITAR